MNTKAIVSAVIAAVCLASGTSASAQSYNDRNDNRYDNQNRYEQRGDYNRGDREYRDNRGDRDNGYARAEQRHDRYNNDNRYSRDDRYERHAYQGDNRRDDRSYRYDGRQDGRAYYASSNRYEVRQGAYLPQEYRSERYVVNDWQQRRLSAPPRGSHWVSAGNDYVLAAIATGLIATVLLNH